MKVVTGSCLNHRRLWQRIARLKDNAVLLAGMYEMPEMKRADIMRFMAANSAGLSVARQVVESLCEAIGYCV